MRSLYGIGILSALLARPTFAAVEPRLASLFPPGGQRGTTVTLAVEGSGLSGASRALVSGEGVTAELGPAEVGAGEEKKPETRQVTVAIASDAAPGVREFRLTGPGGTSNPLFLCVGLWPELVETEEFAEEPRDAAPLPALPVTVNGRLQREADVDCVSFSAAAGETMVLDLTAGVFRSPADPQIELLDASGRRLARRIESGGRDPRLVHRFERAGRYVARVRDVAYRSGAAYSYRLTIGALPVVTRLSPPGGQAGARLAVRIEGVNLGEMREMEVVLPPQVAGGRLTLVPETPNGPALPVTFYAGSEPEALEQEPNDSRATAQRLESFPLTVNGTIDRPGDVDIFRVRLPAGRRLVFEMRADRIGARLDGALRLVDATGRPVASDDDGAGVDPRLEFEAPADGDYFLEVRAADGRGGPDSFYRLQIAEASGPEFALTVTPAAPNVPRGGAARLVVRVARKGGFAGPVTLRAEGLPPGVTASAATIRAGRNVGYLTLVADSDAPMGIESLRVLGEAQIDGRPVQHVAAAIEGAQTAGARRPEIAAAFHVATVIEAAPLALAVEPARVAVKPGGKALLTVRAARRSGVKEAAGKWDLRATEMPEGVTIWLKPIEEGKDAVEIELTATESAAAVVESAVLSAVREGREVFAPAFVVEVGSHTGSGLPERAER